MAFRDFRDFLDSLERNGLLIRVAREVDVKFEIAAGIRKISDTNGPALLFENIKGYPGWKVIGGLFATPRLMAFALQTEENENKLLERYLEFDQCNIEPVSVSSGPVKEVIITGDNVDLTKLPVPIYCEYDVGPYLTSGMEIAKHPVTGIQNAAAYRRQILDRNRTSLLAPPTGNLGLMIQAAEEQGQELGIATVIGAHPAITIAGQIRAPMGVDEVGIAGALRGEPFEVVKCETIDVYVPADAEMIIEGVILPGERVHDGPFGEFPGNYITMSNYFSGEGKPTFYDNVVKVTAITMRKDAIFHAMLTGMPTTENHMLKKWAHAAAIYRAVCSVVPSHEDVIGVNLTEAGTSFNHIVISIHKRAEITVRNIIYTVLGMPGVGGLVVVVDDDIDIYDSFEVEWAIATRVRPDRDVTIIPPVAVQRGTSGIMMQMCKWGIDATVPRNEEPWLYKKAVPPGVDRVDYV